MLRPLAGTLCPARIRKHAFLLPRPFPGSFFATTECLMTESHDLSLDGLDQSLTSAPVRPMPHFIQFMPPLIKDLFQRGVDFSLDPSGALLLSGFYDNGPLQLLVDAQGHFSAIDKRKKSTPITNYDDLVMINYDWWKITNAASKGKKYTAPNSPWLEAFKDKKLVRRSVIYIENDGKDGSDED